MCALVALIAAACGGGSESESSSDPTAASSTTVAAATSTTAVTAPTIPEPVSATASVTGAEEMVYDWSAGTCSAEMRPDLPTSVYRDADGLINLVLSSKTNYRLTGPDFDNLAADCEPVFRSEEDPDPGRYRFQQWLGALYTDDGSTIHAVMHNEFHADEASLASSVHDFSVADDLGGWSYLARGSAGPLDLADAGGEWGVAGTICSIARWGMHPDVGCDPVRRWTAPEAGTYSFHIVVADLGIGGGDGVDLGVTFQEQEARLAELTTYLATELEPVAVDHLLGSMPGHSDRGDGGALVFLFHLPDGTVLFQDTSGHWSGVLADLRADVAIFAAAGRANIDGEPIQGTLAEFIGQQVVAVQPTTVILGHHDDWLPGFSIPTDTAPIRDEIARVAPGTTLLEPGYLAGSELLTG